MIGKSVHLLIAVIWIIEGVYSVYILTRLWITQVSKDRRKTVIRKVYCTFTNAETSYSKSTGNSLKRSSNKNSVLFDVLNIMQNGSKDNI